MTGPPTPPPTTETELKDAARSAQTAEPQPQPQPSAVPAAPPPAEDDAYTTIFPAIVELAAKSDWRGLIKAAEYTDLSGDVDASRRPTRLIIIAPLVLSYLIVDDLPPARYVLTRLPEHLMHGPLGQSLIRLVASTMERKYANVYSQADNLFNLTREPGAFDEKLASVIANMVLTFLETFRARTFKLLSNAYTSLPLALGQVYLGLDADTLIPAVQNNGWAYDHTKKILFPPLRPATVSTTPNFGRPICPICLFRLYSDPAPLVKHILRCQRSSLLRTAWPSWSFDEESYFDWVVFIE